MLALLLLAVATTGSTTPNVLLVTLDTLRADRLRAYGYRAVETPVTDRLAREGVLVEDATAQAPHTRASHASILTGLLPYEHGIRDNFSPPLDAEHPTLATLLQGEGYATAAFIGSFILDASSGLDRGFDHYDAPFSQPGTGAALYTRTERRAEDVVTSALDWLERHRSRPFFAWVHLFDPHSPYDPPPPFDERYRERRYDGEVAYVDAQLGRLIGFLDDTDQRGRTLVVVTADHGEGLGEHGEDEHLLFVYDSTLRVPLLFSWPGVLPQGVRLRGQFQSRDLLATVLDLTGHDAATASGVSRAEAVRRGTPIPANASYAENLYGSIHFGYAPLRALRTGDWKYVEAPRAELYDLREDPGETANLLGDRSRLADDLRAQLAAHDRDRAIPEASVPVDAGVDERLAALGYVGGRPGESPSGIDPKDGIEELQAYRRDFQAALRFYRAGDLDSALLRLRRLAGGETRSFEVQYYLGSTLLQKRSFREAAAALEQAVDMQPRFVGAYVDLSHAYRELGQYQKVRDVLERGLRKDPRQGVLHGELGILLQGLGDLPGASAALERARSLDPGNARIRLALSGVYRDQGNTSGAVTEARRAAELEPGLGYGWHVLGRLLVATGAEDEARVAYRSALRLDEDDPEALLHLGRLYLSAGRADEALRLLERLATVSPRFPSGRDALEAARRAVAGKH